MSNRLTYLRSYAVDATAFAAMEYTGRKSETGCDMTMSTDFETIEPLRASIDVSRGALIVEFGTPWCQFCKAAQPLIAEAFVGFERVRHIKVEDGKGRSLGRSFSVKLWPTLIFLRDGQEVTRLVRPEHSRAIKDALNLMAAGS